MGLPELLFFSRNERELAEERPTEWLIYRVHLFASEPHVFTLTPPLENRVSLRPETWRASFPMQDCRGKL
jgi:hypothetical protein